MGAVKSSKARKTSPRASGTKRRHVDRESPHFSQPRSQLSKRSNPPFEEWEDQLILSHHNAGKGWDTVHQKLPTRTQNSLRSRWTRLSKPRASRRKGRHEDREEIPHFAPRRSQLSKRSNPPFEEWEDQLILSHHNAGKGWDTVHQKLPTRTISSLKSRCYRLPKSRPQDVKSSRPDLFDGEIVGFRRWKECEDELLASLKAEGKSWEYISLQLPRHTPRACRARKGYTLDPLRISWTPEEDKQFLSLHNAGHDLKYIAQQLSPRSEHACRLRWESELKFRATYIPRKTTGRTEEDEDLLLEEWTEEEAQKLITGFHKLGPQWEEIAKKLPGRTGFDCARHFWTRCAETLRIKKSSISWTRKETQLLVSLYNTIGTRWEEIAKHLPGRTASACKHIIYMGRRNKDGLGGPASEIWERYFEDGPDPSEKVGTVAAASDSMDLVHDQDRSFSIPTFTGHNASGIDARKRKVIDIPMV